MSNENFDKLKDKLILKLFNNPKNMKEQADAYEMEISTQCYNFNGILNEVNVLQSIVKSDIVEFYQVSNFVD